MDRPREAKKLIATLFAAPGTVHVGSRAVTVRLMPAASEAERVALRSSPTSRAAASHCQAIPTADAWPGRSDR
jgi:hypothetical protein